MIPGMPVRLMLSLASMVIACAAAPQEVFFQAHRGGIDEVPENTLVALEYAWAIPGAVPEIDLRTSKDGVIVCSHDETPARTTTAPAPWRARAIREIPWEELRQWDAGSHFDPRFSEARIPRIEDLFERMKEHQDRQIYLDVKDADFTALHQLIKEYAIEARVIFVHGDVEMCKKLQALYGGARTMTWISGLPSAQKTRFQELRDTGFAGISQLQFHLKVKDQGPPIEYVLEDEFLAEAQRITKDAGVDLQLRPFEFDPESMKRLIDLGIYWYVADAPRAFADVISEAKKPSRAETRSE